MSAPNSRLRDHRQAGIRSCRASHLHLASTVQSHAAGSYEDHLISTIQNSSSKLDIRTPEIQSGPRTAFQEEHKANKTYRQFYRQSAFPAMTFSNLQPGRHL